MEMAEVAKRDGAGFVEYLWPRSQETKPVAKISFVKGFPAWGWMIGTGFYVEDIDRYILGLMLSAGAVLAAVIAGAMLLVAFVSRSISVPMGQAVAMIEALESGDLDHRLHLAQRDEVGRLAKSLDAFADNLQYEILTAFDRLAHGDFSFAAQGLIREPLAQTNARLNVLVAKLDRTATEALEERIKTDALIAAIGEGVAIFDAEQKFVYQNPIHISLAGSHAGEPCYRAFHGYEHACDDCAIAKALGDGQIHKMVRRGTVSSRPVYIDVTASPVRDAAGKIISVIEIARDVTDRKLAEEELKEKNAELERFTYTVSHDLKSPLVTIKAFLGFLKQDMAAADMVRIDRDLAFMHTAADKMWRLLDELLEMARVGRNVNPPVAVSLAELVAEALTAVAGRIAERGVEVRVESNDVVLFGDRPRLVEIWQNLIDNAVKYMGEKSAPRIDIGLESGKGGPIYYVRDNGLGIEPGFHEKIFGLFEKLDQDSEGSGLGLALVKRIVEFNGGRIWVESSGVGQGSCFWFTLPAAKN
jgi:PAS domain S-box-containing protein